MRGQCGSCESYRLGSVKALPIGTLLLPVFLVGSHSDGVHFTLKMATCYSAVIVGLPPFSFVTSTCHIFCFVLFFCYNCFPSSLSISRLTFALCFSLYIGQCHFMSLTFSQFFFSFFPIRHSFLSLGSQVKQADGNQAVVDPIRDPLEHRQSTAEFQ